MPVQRSISFCNPYAVSKNVIVDIFRRFEENGLSGIATNLTHLSAAEAGRFYAVHAARPFFADLCSFMSSGPILAMVLEGKNAVTLNRQLMGATNPKEAEAGTIRADHADSIDANAVHGSDSEENAAIEVAFFFSDLDLHSRG